MEDLHIKAEEQVEKMTDREVASLLGISLKSYIINKKENWDKAIDKKVQDLYDDIVGEQEARAEAMKEEGYAKGGKMANGGKLRYRIIQDVTDTDNPSGAYVVIDTENNKILKEFDFKKEAQEYIKQLNIGSMAKGGKFESAEDAYNQASYYLSDNKVPSKEVALKKHGNKLDKLLGNYSNSLYPILDAYYNNDDKQTMREWFDEIESSHYAKGGKIDALDRYLMVDSIVHWFKFKKEEVEKWSDDKLIQWSNKANKGVAKGMRFGKGGSMATGSLTFKKKVGTEKEHAHTEVYFGDKYIGYYMPNTSEFAAVDENWNFVSKNTDYPNLRAKTQKEIISLLESSGGSMATGGSVMVRMKVSDMDDFTDYLQDSNIQRNQITFEEDDFIVVSKDLADELENDKVAYTIMGNIHGYSKGGEMSDKTIIYYVKGDEVVTNISLTEVEALQAQEKHNKTFVSKYGFGHIYKTEVATSDWNDGKIMASNWKEWERKKNTSGVAMETGGNLQDKYEQTRNQNLIYHGFDVLKLSQNQKNLILEPNEAPENYMMDGEINAKQAFGMWKNRLVKSGLSASDVKRAIELNFKYSGGKLHNLIKSEEHKNQ